jgi:hypothetical protein
VYILGKGETGKQEYALRIYSLVNTESPVRPNRISAYAFNLAGGLGSGAYFQDPVMGGSWIMVTFVIDDDPTSTSVTTPRSTPIPAVAPPPSCWQESNLGTNTAASDYTRHARHGNATENVAISSYTSGDRKLLTAQGTSACSPGSPRARPTPSAPPTGPVSPPTSPSTTGTPQAPGPTGPRARLSPLPAPGPPPRSPPVPPPCPSA